VENLFYETVHNASADYPYFDEDMRNINYISHFHEEIEIIMVIDGVVEITDGTEHIKAEKDDICVFMPGTIHGFTSTDSNHLYVMKLHCKNSEEKIDFLNLRLKSCLLEKESPLYNCIYENIHKIALEKKQKKYGYGFAVNSISNDIICNILRFGKISEEDDRHGKRHTFYRSLLKDVNSYLEKHYKEQIQLSDISKSCNLSQYYFAHVFKDITNTTFNNYLTTYRLEKALKSLSSGEKIINVAYECGFTNLRTFNRTFKKVYNMTPSEYKKTCVN